MPFPAALRVIPLRQATAACLMAMTVAGCTTLPTETAATLPQQDPKWSSPQCQQVRAEAAGYKERKVYWAAGALLGPYGLGIVATAKQHQETQRRLFARDLHVACSSQPLPRDLQGIDPSAKRQIK